MAVVAVSPSSHADDEEGRLFLIPILIGFLRWVEEAITALSGYGIIFALAVGVVDLLTDGSFSSQAPWVDYAYAWAMALGIAGQIVGLSSRSSRSYNQGRWIRGTAFGLLVLVLAYVEYQAGIIFAFHKTFGTPVVQSLTQLGLTQDIFIRSRTAVAVALSVLSGFLRYQPRRKLTIEEIEAENERKARIAASNAKARQAQLGTFISTVAGAGQAAAQAARSVAASAGDGSASNAPSHARQEMPDEDASGDGEGGDTEGADQGKKRRRSFEEMDALRADMLTQGYPVAQVSEKENERIFQTLVERRRQSFVLGILNWTPEQYDQALTQLRRQRRAAGKE